MKKKINTPPSNAGLLIISGIIMLLTAPFIKPLYLALTLSGCPQYEERRLCGLESIESGINALVLSLIWLVAGIIVLIVGIMHHREHRKKS